jgi:UDP:flavonoid glycosyltransferase YjiC (YdhE family)
MVPLGWALQAAGHEVRVLCAPSQATPVANAGFIPVPIIDGLDPVLSNRLQYYHEAVAGSWPYPWLPLHPVTGREITDLRDFDVEEFRATVEVDLIARTRDSFDRVAQLTRSWRPDLVLHDPASLEGVFAARLMGVPAALCLWGPVGTHEPEHMRIVPQDFSGSFPRHGLEPFHLGMIDRVVDPCPAELAPPTTAQRLAMRYVPYNGCSAAAPWLFEAPERRRVCVAWSTALSVMSGPASYLVPLLIESLADLDCELVVTATAGDVAALGSLPRSVRVLEHLPLRLLLATCEAVVHHGGSGNTMTALCHGVPQLAVTFASEQAAAADRVTRTGAGLHLPGHRADKAAVRESAWRLLTEPSFRQGAAAVRDAIIARPTPADLVSTLEDLA